MADANYQEKTYRKQGGDEFVVASGGVLNVEDGGFFHLNGGITTAAQLKQVVADAVQVSLIAQGAGSTMLSVKNLPADIRYVIFSMTSTLVTGSFWLTSDAVVGREIYFTLRQGSTASGQVWVSCSGCTLIGELGVAISGFYLKNSVASTAKVHLVCFSDGEWSVNGWQGGYAE